MENASKYKAEFFSKVQKLIDEGNINPKYKNVIEYFYTHYVDASNVSAELLEKANHHFNFFLDLVLRLSQNPFVFEPYHKRVTSPINYYRFGVDFMSTLVDSGSFVKGEKNVEKIVEQIANGENVVLLANHQIEADPQAISILLEKKTPKLGEEMIFVAGERVITDPLAVPFSMGRNLLCIYSKRYIDYPPEHKMKKQLHNKKTMETMSQLFDEGGKCIYVAPSGGRDRKNAKGEIEVAPFDPQSVEMFYFMAKRAKKKTHFYPLTVNTYDMLPPPETIQIEIGELRKANRVNISISFGDEIDMETIVSEKVTDKHEMRRLKAEHIWKIVKDEFTELRRQT